MTPRPFVSACDKFIFTEVLVTKEDCDGHSRKQKVNELKGNTRLVGLFRSAIGAASDESGWADLSAVGSNIVKQAPEFDPRNYGYTKLSELVSAIDLFEIEKRGQSKGHPGVIHIRDKRKKPATSQLQIIPAK